MDGIIMTEGAFALSYLDEQSYRSFLAGQERWFFSQSPAYMRFNKSQGSPVDCLGLLYQGKLVLAGKLIYRRMKRLFYSAEMNFAPLYDVKHPEYLAAFLELLLPYLKRNKRVLRFRIAAPVQVAVYEDLEKVEDCAEAVRTRTMLEDLGFTRNPKDLFSDASLQAHYLYVKKIAGMTEEQLMDSLQYRVRNDMRRAKRYGIQVRMLKADELSIFNEMLAETIARTGMDAATTTEARPEILEQLKDEVFFPLAYLDCAYALQNLEREEAELRAEYEAIGELAVTKKNVNKQKAVQEQLDALAARRAEIETIEAAHGPIVPLAAAQFCLSASDMVYLQSVSKDAFVHLSAVYAIQEVFLLKALESNCSYYNFFAVENPFVEGADRGVLDFKRRFAGQLEEYIGTYECTVNWPFLKGLY